MKFFKRNKQAEAAKPSSEPAADNELVIEPVPEKATTVVDEAPSDESDGVDDAVAPNETAAKEEKAGFFSRLGFRRKKQGEASEPSPSATADSEQPLETDKAPVAGAPEVREFPAALVAESQPEAVQASDEVPALTVVVEEPQVAAPVEPPPEEPAKDEERAAPEAAATQGEKTGFFSRLRRGLGRTSDNLVQGLGNLFLGHKEIDADLFEELESRLLMADVGIEATLDIIKRLTQRVSRKELTRPEALHGALREELLALLQPCEQPLDVQGHQPYVILMVGVNGVGKTTTIGKLAKHYMENGRSVMLAAGDTFRAAAVEQLQVWGERNDVPVVAQHTGADSASVLFDALQAARARKVDVLIADTAGRLHNKDNLMEELKKVVRVMGKIDPSAPHEVMLVLDAGTGQNALAQAEHFQQWVGVSGITLTKLDGTAKGGIIFAIAKKLQLPIRFIGVGEAVEDLRPFQAEQFIEALFDVDNASA
jgi:fused signal recognition particle receptor